METNNGNNSTPPGESTPAPETSPAPAPASVRRREQQDKEIVNGISESRRIITSLQNDGPLRASLGDKGYDTQEIGIGQSLQIAAQATFNDRQSKMGAQDEAQDALDKLVVAARNNYADFRRVARVLFKSKADRTKLGLLGIVPGDLQKFVTVATGSYTEAAKAPYQAKFTKKGFKPAVLTGLLGALTALDPAAAAQKKAETDAVDATRARDTAWGVLKNWMVELRETAKTAFRNAPEQARKVDF